MIMRFLCLRLQTKQICLLKKLSKKKSIFCANEMENNVPSVKFDSCNTKCWWQNSVVNATLSHWIYFRKGWLNILSAKEKSISIYYLWFKSTRFQFGLLQLYRRIWLLHKDYHIWRNNCTCCFKCTVWSFLENFCLFTHNSVCVWELYVYTPTV